MKINITQQQAQHITAALNCLARSAEDTIGAAATLLPLRQKLEAAAADEIKERQADGNANGEDSDVSEPDDT